MRELGVSGRWASVIAMVTAIALASCHSTEEVRIGFVGDLSSELGIGGRNGAELALTEINERGSVRYEVLVKDDRNDREVVQASIESLAAHHVAFVVGPMTSAMAVAAVPVANRIGLVMISPTATTDELTGQDDSFFRTAGDVPSGAARLARALRQRQLHSLVVLTDAANAAYSSSFGHAVLDEFLRTPGSAGQELTYRSGKSLELADALTGC